MDNKKKLFIGIGISVLVLVVIVLIIMYMQKKPAPQVTKAAVTKASTRTNNLPTPTPAPTLPPGQLPVVGKPFYVISKATGKYLMNNGMTSNKANAGVYTVDSNYTLSPTILIGNTEYSLTLQGNNTTPQLFLLVITGGSEYGITLGKSNSPQGVLIGSPSDALSASDLYTVLFQYV